MQYPEHFLGELKNIQSTTVTLFILKNVNLFSYPITTVLLKCFELFSRTL